MDGREMLVGVVATTKWLVYCGGVAVVGGGIVFVLAVAWLGVPVQKVVRETPVFGAVSPSIVAVGVLFAAVVMVLDADLRS
ncbi:hypothetical protein BV210_03560 [Halorientalis sp. IM1011]|uniref:hypothetical protein n=1 Tax=Halorientalis sp. IM1011 TaxID=1932360 RepID=UPI00097CC20E|nr:hypothetical protein [Halorientalis sp. IM1011]AQL41848.1 hypothetical protein BV210_03560 [Halorientalis sp. IM1011]